jgi:two-component system, chemotaxis family, protein-glutamate methylesterase/glutaminase
MSDRIKVLIVDDSSLMRKIISNFFLDATDIEVAGTAMNGRFGLQKMTFLSPDVIILDLEMPEMNGIEFLKEKKRLGNETPVIILSSHAERGAKVTMEAIAAGASDFLLKPTAGQDVSLPRVAEQLMQLVRIYGALARKHNAPAVVEAREPVEKPVLVKVSEPQAKKRIPRRRTERIDIIAIGISTGGPNALRIVLPQLREDLDLPILVVQHMPPGFTEEFAYSLNRICQLDVKEAADGDVITGGRVFIAPGDRHIVVRNRPLARVIELDDSGPRHGHKPSADVLFASVARVYQNHACALLMTGMGRDGAEEMGSIYEEGGLTLAQDAETSVVFGMPKVAIGLGYVREVLALQEIPGYLNRLNREENGV